MKLDAKPSVALVKARKVGHALTCDDSICLGITLLDLRPGASPEQLRGSRVWNISPETHVVTGDPETEAHNIFQNVFDTV